MPGAEAALPVLLIVVTAFGLFFAFVMIFAGTAAWFLLEEAQALVRPKPSPEPDCSQE